MARLGFQSGWIHFFVKKERRTGENRENREMPFYFPFSLFSLFSPVPSACSDPGNHWRIRAGHAGIVAEIGDPVQAEEILVKQGLASDLARIFLYQFENAINKNVRLAPSLSVSKSPVERRLALDNRDWPERIDGDVVFPNFLGQSMSQKGHAKFGDEIGDFSGNDFRIDRRRHVDDVPPLPLYHMRKDGSGGQKGGPDIHGHD